MEKIQITGEFGTFIIEINPIGVTIRDAKGEDWLVDASTFAMDGTIRVGNIESMPHKINNRHSFEYQFTNEEG